jgi:hypothetical protein
VLPRRRVRSAVGNGAHKFHKHRVSPKWVS